MAQDERIFILPAGAHGQDLRVVSLPHPKTDEAARFLVSAEQGKFMELQKMGPQYASWFKDQSVIQGKLFLATPIDPLFLIIPLLERARMKTEESQGYYHVLEEIMTHDANFTDIYALFLKDQSFEEQLRLLCDVTERNEEVYYRLSDDKVLRWLRCKVQHMQDYLEASPALADGLKSGSKSTGYVVSTFSSISESDLKKAAAGFISEYISHHWQQKLCTYFGIPLFSSAQDLPTQGSHSKRRTLSKEPAVPAPPIATPSADSYVVGDISHYNERPKTAGGGESSPATPSKKTIQQKRLEKVDTRGMASLSKYFVQTKKKD